MPGGAVAALAAQDAAGQQAQYAADAYADQARQPYGPSIPSAAEQFAAVGRDPGAQVRAAIGLEQAGMIPRRVGPAPQGPPGALDAPLRFEELTASGTAPDYVRNPLDAARRRYALWRDGKSPYASLDQLHADYDLLAKAAGFEDQTLGQDLAGSFMRGKDQAAGALGAGIGIAGGLLGVEPWVDYAAQSSLGLKIMAENDPARKVSASQQEFTAWDPSTWSAKRWASAVTEQLVSNMPSLATALTGSTPGLIAGQAIGGLQEASDSFNDAFDDWINRGESKMSAARMAGGEAAAYGVVASLLERLGFPEALRESLKLNPAARAEARAGIRAAMGRVLKTAGETALGEALEEGAQTVAQQTFAANIRDKERDPGEVASAAILGGVTGAVQGTAPQALGEAARAAFSRSPSSAPKGVPALAGAPIRAPAPTRLALPEGTGAGPTATETLAPPPPQTDFEAPRKSPPPPAQSAGAAEVEQHAPAPAPERTATDGEEAQQAQAQVLTDGAAEPGTEQESGTALAPPRPAKTFDQMTDDEAAAYLDAELSRTFSQPEQQPQTSETPEPADLGRSEPQAQPPAQTEERQDQPEQRDWYASEPTRDYNPKAASIRGYGPFRTPVTIEDSTIWSDGSAAIVKDAAVDQKALSIIDRSRPYEMTRRVTQKSVSDVVNKHFNSDLVEADIGKTVDYNNPAEPPRTLIAGRDGSGIFVNEKYLSAIGKITDFDRVFIDKNGLAVVFQRGNKKVALLKPIRMENGKAVVHLSGGHAASGAVEAKAPVRSLAQDVPGVRGEDDSKSRPEAGPKPTERQQKKIELDDELRDALKGLRDHFNKQGGSTTFSTLGPPPIDPETLRAVSRVLVALVRRGVHEFGDAVRFVQEHAPDLIGRAASAIEAGWTSLRKINPNLSETGRVADLVRPTENAGGQEADNQRPGHGGPRGAAALEEVPASGVRIGGEGGNAGQFDPGSAGGGRSDVEGDGQGGHRPGDRPVGSGKGVPLASGRPDGRGEAGTGVAGSGESGVTAGTAKPAPAKPAQVKDAPKPDQTATPAPQTLPAYNPDSKARGGNYRIRESDLVEFGGAVARFNNNLAAIRLVKQLEREGRWAREDEKPTLVKYVGWGGLSNVFDENNRSTADRRQALRDLIGPEEYEAARRSTINAHYTSKEVIGAIWDGLAAMGFKGGVVHEPAIGVGHFFGLMPTEMMEASRLAGSDRDILTARIAQNLYQQADIRAEQFQDIALKDDSVDLFISNVPFANVPVRDPHDRTLDRLNLPVHDYFFAKAVKKTRTGGLIGFITSRFTLDKVDSGLRRRLQDMGADMVGAVRLPYTAFSDNANTEVVTDFIVLQKRAKDAKPGGAPFTKTGSIEVGGQKAVVNDYFIDNPSNVLGAFAMTGTMYGKGGLNVEPGALPLRQSMTMALSRIAQNVDRSALDAVSTRTQEAADNAEKALGYAIPELREGNLHLVGDRLTQVRDGKLYPVKVPHGLGKDGVERIRDLLNVRDAARELRRLQIDPEATEEQVDQARAALNRVYDAVVSERGVLNQQINRKAIGQDTESVAVLSLENYDHNAGTATKADIFSKRTQQPFRMPDRADTIDDALSNSLSIKGRLDIDYMASLLGRTPESVVEDLGERVYEDPNAGFVTADEYLSGNVRQKLVQAREAGEKYARNVAALEKVQPEDLTPGQISVMLGAAWIDANDYQDFVASVLRRKVKVRYVEQTGAWTVSFLGASRSVEETTDYGTDAFPGSDLFEKAMTFGDIAVYDKHPDGSRSINKEKTLAAKAKLDRIQDAFREWLWNDDRRSERLVRRYNDTFNNTVERRYDGSHLQLPGKSSSITLRPYQMNAIWRAISGGNVLLDHAVGAGKTWTMAAIAMEKRRLGQANKPVFVLPNHLIQQFPSEFLSLYPSAKILTLGSDDLSKDRRKVVLNRIATGDWDAVFIPQSSFERIPMSPDRQRAFFQNQINTLIHAAEEARRDEGKKSQTVKELEKARERLETMLQDLSAEWKKDDGPFFDQLGVDAMFVDEAHDYKNLWFATRRSRTAGISPQMTQKAFDMYMKASHLNRTTQGRNVVFATGTPVSNSMSELWTMMRYLAPGLLERRGIEHFDAWSAMAGRIVSQVEVSPDGGGVRTKERFSKFVNVPETMQAYRTFADTIGPESLGIQRPAILGGRAEVVVVEPSRAIKDFVKALVRRAEQISKGRVDPTEDNMLAVVTDGRKAALDMRLVDRDGAHDLPGSKVNTAVRNIYSIWKETEASRLTQLVWSDLGAPAGKGFNLYADIKRKLAAMGVPENQVAFIHDADTEDKKRALFNAMKDGSVRVLIGSSAKLATGANIQTRLYAAHHLDAPWRPSDVEQRDGRIERFGNLNKQVRIIRYVTKGTFDAYTWQTLERKLAFIKQLRQPGDGSERESPEDLDSAVLSFSEIKALASNDQRIFTLHKLNSELVKLAALERGHLDSQWKLRIRDRDVGASLKEFERSLPKAEADAEAIKAARENAGDGFLMTVGGAEFSSRKEAGRAILAEINKPENVRKEIGRYAGFVINGPAVPGSLGVFIDMPSGDKVPVSLGESDVGNISRIDNALEAAQEKAGLVRNWIENAKSELSKIRERLSKPFDRAEELARVRDEYAALVKDLHDNPARSDEDESEEEDDHGPDDNATVLHGGFPVHLAVPAILAAVRATDNALAPWHRPMIDALRKAGGPRSREIADEFDRAADDVRGMRGLIRPYVNRALRAASGQSLASRRAVAEVSRIVWDPSGQHGETALALAVEGRLPTGTVLSPQAQRIVDGYRGVVSVTGRMAEAAGVAFKDGTLFKGVQGGRVFLRNTSPEVWDILSGPTDRPGFVALTKAIAGANGITEEEAKSRLLSMKNLAQPPSNGPVSMEHPDNFEFRRELPRMPTHFRVNGEIVPALHADPYGAVMGVAEQAVHRLALIRRFGQDGMRTLMGSITEEGDKARRALSDLTHAFAGVPLDRGSPPEIGTLARKASDAANTIMNLLAVANLSGAFIQNLFQVLSQGPAMFGVVGPAKGFAQMIADAARDPAGFGKGIASVVEELRMIGAVRDQPYNFSMDRERPVGSLIRMLSGVALAPFRYANLFNDYAVAAMARTMARRLERGKPLFMDYARLRMMGFNKEDAGDIIAGKGTKEDYRAIVQRAAARTQGSNMTQAEQGRLLSQRWFKSAFRFTSYGAMVFNRLAESLRMAEEAFRDKSPGNIRRKAEASAFLASFLGGHVAAGALAGIALAGIYGGLAGLMGMLDDAENKPEEFLLDAMVNALFGGPIQTIVRGVGSLDRAKMMDAAGRVVYPVGKVMEIAMMAGGAGPYKDLETPDRFLTLLSRQVPISRPMLTALGAASIATGDPDLTQAERAYWRERGDIRAEAEDKKFRRTMKSLVAELDQEKPEREKVVALLRTAALDGADGDRIRASLLGRRLIVTMKPEDQKKMLDRIGQRRFDRILEKDRLLTAWADAILPPDKREAALRRRSR